MSHGSILFLRNSVIVRTIDGGETWTNHKLPFQVTGPLIFHPREEDWILGRGVVNGKVHFFCYKSLIKPPNLVIGRWRQ